MFDDLLGATAVTVGIALAAILHLVAAVRLYQHENTRLDDRAGPSPK